MGARLIVVEGRAGRSEAESRKRGDGLLGATGSDGAEGACADGIFDTTTVTTPNPASQSSELDLATPDAALTSAPPLGAALGLSGALAQVNLSQFEPALRELGVATCTDIADLEGSDCIEIGMKPLEVKRLMRL